ADLPLLELVRKDVEIILRIRARPPHAPHVNHQLDRTAAKDFDELLDASGRVPDRIDGKGLRRWAAPPGSRRRAVLRCRGRGGRSSPCSRCKAAAFRPPCEGICEARRALWAERRWRARRNRCEARAPSARRPRP